jgi:epoxide hydrolase-like predicted phosphatase
MLSPLFKSLLFAIGLNIGCNLIVYGGRLIKAVIFDLGGVLIKSAFTSFSLEIAAVFDVSAALVDKALRKHWPDYLTGKIAREEFWHCFAQDTGLEDDADRFENSMLSSCPLDVETYKIVKQLKGRYFLVLLTNVAKEWLEHVRKRYLLNRIFNEIFASYEMGAAKPHDFETKQDYTLFYRLVLKQIGFKVEECVFIDDHEENLKPAAELGMHVIHFKDASQLKQQLRKLGVAI